MEEYTASANGFVNLYLTGKYYKLVMTN